MKRFLLILSSLAGSRQQAAGSIQLNFAPSKYLRTQAGEQEGGHWLSTMTCKNIRTKIEVQHCTFFSIEMNNSSLKCFFANIILWQSIWRFIFNASRNFGQKKFNFGIIYLCNELYNFQVWHWYHEILFMHKRKLCFCPTINLKFKSDFNLNSSNNDPIISRPILISNKINTFLMILQSVKTCLKVFNLKLYY